MVPLTETKGNVSSSENTPDSENKKQKKDDSGFGRIKKWLS